MSISDIFNKDNNKILLCAMSMNSGGAETHIFELALFLKKRGFEVLLASNGGELQNQLENEGIKSIILPLNSRRIKPMTKCFFSLRRIIKKEKIKIVHAHARIPGFILEMIRKSFTKRKRFRLVLTCHGTYEVTPLLKKFSCWGQKTIAVSEDIKEYLLKNYELDANDIILSVNGIDTQRFCRREEKKLGDKTIVHVSRLDSESCLCAEKLIEAIPIIIKKHPNVSLEIAGGGDCFEKIKSKADEMNKSLGFEYIKMLGVSKDVEKVLERADCFVGVSRASLEAMSMNLPTVLAGAQGALYTLSDENLLEAVKTNFTCRGQEKPTAELLSEHICTIMDSDIPVFCKKSREFVMENYSISKMTDDAITAYEAVLKNKEAQNDIFAVGYYGNKNAGDEAMLQSILLQMRNYKKDLKICALSSNPKETKSEFGINAIFRFDFLAIVKTIRHSRAVVFGGGSLLQDVTSIRSIRYYSFILRYAKKCGKKTALFANGIGPICTKAGERILYKTIPIIDAATLRDEKSFELYKRYGGKNAILSADSVFMLPEERLNENNVKKVFGKIALNKEKQKYFVIALRPLEQKNQENLEKAIIDICISEISKGLCPVFAVFQSSLDTSIAKKLSGICNAKIAKDLTFGEYGILFENAQFALVMRYHALVGSCTKTPTLALSYDPKVTSLAEELEVMSLDANTVKIEELYSALEKLKNENINSFEVKKRQILDKVKELKEKSKLDAEYILNFVGFSKDGEK